MKIFRNRIIMACLLPFACIMYLTGQDSLLISEFMAINNTVLQDEDGDYSDWIEIHNAGSTDAILKNWCLTDDKTVPMKWIFPDITIAAKEYVVVFASEKDRRTEKNKLHCNFKLSGSGEYLALMKPGGTIAATEFSPAFPEQYADISYGISSPGYRYLAEPSPGAPNTEDEFISPPRFSVGHGFFNDAFDLELTCATEGVDIYYTTDAGTPDRSQGTKYSGPVHVTTTTVIRAVAVKEGAGESRSVTQTYVFPADVVLQSEDQPGYPSTWLTPIHGTDNYNEIPSDYGMREDFLGIPEVSDVILESLTELPVVSIVSDIGNFFSKSTHPDSGGIYMYNGEPDGPTIDLTYHLGRGWERPASVEYFNSDADDGSISFQANCVVKIHGGATRTREKTHKHSFRLGFKSEYGPSKLEVQLFGKDSPGQYDWLVLRGGFAGAAVQRFGQQVRDPWSKSSMYDMGQYAARSKFVHVYLNGLYWGMYNLCERMDDNSMRDNLGGDADDYDILKDYFEIQSGDTIAWTKMVTMAEDNIENPANYQKMLGNNPDGTPNDAYEKMVNPENLIDYIMMNMHAGMRDWDYHNWIAARRKTDSEGFHFLVWDAEGAFQLTNNVTYIVSGGEYNRPTGVFADLMKNEQFSNQFIRRVNKHFFEGGALTPAPCLARYNKWLDEIDTALIGDQARWGGSNDIWNTSYHQFRFTYFPARTEMVFKQFISAGIYPVVEAPVFNTANTVIPEDFQLMMTAPDGGEIRYTLDGTDPGHFSLSASSSIMVYDNLALPLDRDTLNILARVKKDTLWSVLVSGKFIVDDLSSSVTDALSGTGTYFYCYPNPVTQTARIVFNLKQEADVSLTVYTILGVKMTTIADTHLPGGEHTVSWDAGDLPAGIYICRLTNRTENTSSRIRIIKE